MTEKNTPEIALRIRLTSLPDPSEFDEFDLSRFCVGQTYELPLRLASLLILGGYAESVGPSLHAQAADFGQFKVPKRT